METTSYKKPSRPCLYGRGDLCYQYYRRAKYQLYKAAADHLTLDLPGLKYYE